jgi:hypothetical protein
MADPFRPLTKMSVITRDEASVIPRAWTPPQARADIAPPALSASKATVI